MTRKCPISSSDDDFEEDEAHIDRALEEKLQECAKRNNLSSLEIKKILKVCINRFKNLKSSIMLLKTDLKKIILL